MNFKSCKPCSTAGDTRSGISEHEYGENQGDGTTQRGILRGSKEEQAHRRQRDNRGLNQDHFQSLADYPRHCVASRIGMLDTAGVGDIARGNDDDAEVAEQQEIENLQSDQPDPVVPFTHGADVEGSQPQAHHHQRGLINVREKRPPEEGSAARH